jgi:hypothetical protein
MIIIIIIIKTPPSPTSTPFNVGRSVFWNLVVQNDAQHWTGEGSEHEILHKMRKYVYANQKWNKRFYYFD